MNRDEAAARLASALAEVAEATPLAHLLPPPRAAGAAGDGRTGGEPPPSAGGPTVDAGRGWLDPKLLVLAGCVVLVAVGALLVGHQLGRGTTSPTARTTLPVAGTVVVPDLVGMGQPQVTQVAHAIGVTVHIHFVRSTAPVAAVIAQAPAAGSKVAAGGIVTVEISDGDAPPPVPGATTVVPDVVGLALDPALHALEAVGLTNSIGSGLAGCQASGAAVVVSAQSPVAGAVVPQDSRVSLSLDCPVAGTTAG